MSARDGDGASGASGDGDWVELTVRANSGGVQDPRELETILRCSLRDLFGDLESHSSNMSRVAAAGRPPRPLGSASGTRSPPDQPQQQPPAAQYFTLTCRRESAAAVRAALTLVTPPPYLEGSLYRFDVLGSSDGALGCSSRNLP